MYVIGLIDLLSNGIVVNNNKTSDHDSAAAWDRIVQQTEESRNEGLRVAKKPL